MNRNVVRTSLAPLVAILLAIPTAALSQDRASEWLEQCRSESSRWNRDDDRHRACRVQEITIPASGELSVDGRQNGGIAVQGWDRDEVRIEARITASARSEQRAAADADAIRILTDGGRVRADGPDSRRNESWSVSYRIFAPRGMALDLEAHNGGISVDEMRGGARLSTVNGGLSLSRISGDVRGRTTNGGIKVELDGDRWRGDGLDLETTNGGITLDIPRNYSARLETGTVNGRIDTEIPITVTGSVSRTLSTELGSGGAPIRAVTTNGGVRIRSAR